MLSLKDNRPQAIAAIADFEAAMPTMAPDALLAQLDSYDLLHRLIYRRPAPDEPQDSTLLAIFNRRLRGDLTISDSLLYTALVARIRQHHRPYHGAPMRWLSLTIEEWYHQAMDGDLEPDSDENRRRIHCLLTTDLRAFTLDQAGFKASISCN